MTKDIKIKYDFNLRVLEYEGPAELLDSVLERIVNSSLGKMGDDVVGKRPKQKVSKGNPTVAGKAKAPPTKNGKKK